MRFPSLFPSLEVRLRCAQSLTPDALLPSVFNYSMVFVLTYLVTIHDWSTFSILPKKKAPKVEALKAVQVEEV